MSPNQPLVGKGKKLLESPILPDMKKSASSGRAQSESKEGKEETSSIKATPTNKKENENEHEPQSDYETRSPFGGDDSEEADVAPTRTSTPVMRPLAPKANFFKRGSENEVEDEDEVSENSDASSPKQKIRREHQRILLQEHSSGEQDGGDESSKNPAEGAEAKEKERVPEANTPLLPRTPPLQTDLPVQTPMAPKAYYKRARYLRGLPMSPRVRPMRVVSGPNPVGESDVDWV